jgi:hypothetical protein
MIDEQPSTFCLEGLAVRYPFAPNNVCLCLNKKNVPFVAYTKSFVTCYICVRTVRIEEKVNFSANIIKSKKCVVVANCHVTFLQIVMVPCYFSFLIHFSY